jgi:hypothetical protein
MLALDEADWDEFGIAVIVAEPPPRRDRALSATLVAVDAGRLYPVGSLTSFTERTGHARRGCGGGRTGAGCALVAGRDR